MYKCSICCSNVKPLDKIRCYFCNNKYHKICANKWITVNNSCPVCRCKNFTISLVPIFGPALPPNFIFWAGKSRCITEELDLVEKSFKSDINTLLIDTKMCDDKAELFITLMINKYGPEIDYRT
jgi:hypothetical protein